MSTTLTFEYKARNASGKLVKGSIEAPSQASAISKVSAMGVSPIAVREKSTTGLNMEINIPGLTGGVKKQDLAVSFRQMATMIGAGLSLVTTLAILAEQTDSKPLQRALHTVRTDVEQGRSFSDSLEKQERVFPPLAVSLIRAGETGGFLERSLESVAVNFEKEVKLTGSIKSAMTMPMIVMVVAVLAIIGMMIFVVPVFKSMFEQLGGELPLPTQILVGMSNSALIWVPALIVVVVVGTIWWRRNRHKPWLRSRVDPIKLRMPVFGVLTTKIAIARFARNFAQMMGAGVPVLRALQIVGETSGNFVIEQAMHRIADSVRIGGTIAGPLAHEKVFPSMVVQMIAVGESSGALETMLHKVADFYDDQVETETEQLSKAIEPVMTSLLGVIVGFMVIALYMPMFDLMGAVSNSGG